MDRSRIKCVIRHRWMVITPEELVRQGVLTYLIDELDYPPGRFSVECTVKVNGMRKRADAIVHDRSGKALMVIECKRQEAKIDERTVSQVAMYNHSLDAPYLLLTNGQTAHMFRISREKNEISVMKEIPKFEDL